MSKAWDYKQRLEAASGGKINVKVIKPILPLDDFVREINRGEADVYLVIPSTRAKGSSFVGKRGDAVEVAAGSPKIKKKGKR